MDPDSSLSLALVILSSLLFSGFITVYETSLSHLSSVRLQKRAEEGDKKSIYLQKVLHNPHQTLLTLMVCDWLADVTLLMCLAYGIFHYNQSPALLAASIVIMTPMILIFGEALPKSIATKSGEKIIYQWLPLLQLLLFLFYLPVKILSAVTNPFLDIVGVRFGKIVSDFTEEELRRMVNLSGTTGVLEAEETVLVSSALAFDDKPAKEVLTPRVDMVTVENTTTVNEALEIMIGDEGEGYSRLPVYKDNLDQIIGVVHIKDLLKVRHLNEKNGQRPIEDFVRAIHHVSEYQTIDNVLKEMQARRTPMFIVSDEYGGTLGLITTEDLLEEIVGEIHDEYDIEETPQIVEIDKHTIQVDARLSVSELNEVMDLNLSNGKSVGGLVFDLIGQVPHVGETIQVDNVVLTVDEMDGIRIQKIRIHKLLKRENAEPLLEESEIGNPVG